MSFISSMKLVEEIFPLQENFGIIDMFLGKVKKLHVKNKYKNNI